MPPTVETYDAQQILTRGAGYLSDYDYSLNPYVGCAFGCSYCYAAFFAPFDKQESWGDWVRVKQNAAAKLTRMRRSLEGKTIYMSSATDPYQPIERR
ncbi:MAG: radical SAM protein, partial [Chloroflexi bacterium]|nr:radical SAM protein [Chloroflexota bacterium]